MEASQTLHIALYFLEYLSFCKTRRMANNTLWTERASRAESPCWRQRDEMWESAWTEEFGLADTWN